MTISRFLSTVAMALLFVAIQPAMFAQSPQPASAASSAGQQTGAGAKPTFDVISVKINNAGLPPVGPMQSFKVTGGYLSATNAPLIGLISYAYGSFPAQLPPWAISERLDVEARASGNPTEDQVRLMVQSMLANRFKFASHYEQRQTPVYNLVVAKPGKLGPQLRPFANEEPCPAANPPLRTTIAEGYPARCGGSPEPLEPKQQGFSREGGRNVSLAQIGGWAKIFGHLDRPVFDQTGLNGNFDFMIEWDPKASNDPPADSTGPTFVEALQDQLGLKLDASTASVKTFVIDHIEQPTPN